VVYCDVVLVLCCGKCIYINNNKNKPKAQTTRLYASFGLISGSWWRSVDVEVAAGAATWWYVSMYIYIYIKKNIPKAQTTRLYASFGLISGGWW
jgi:hypothetical protein